MLGDRPCDQEGLQQRGSAQPDLIGLIGAQSEPPEIAIHDLGGESEGPLACCRELIERGGKIGHATGALRALPRTNQDGGGILIH